MQAGLRSPARRHGDFRRARRFRVQHVVAAIDESRRTSPARSLTASVTRIQKSVRQERSPSSCTRSRDRHARPRQQGAARNLTGVYRWVDKYYEAQIYNYGKRMMFEFIIPEPAAFYGYAQTHQPKVAITPPMPLPAGLTTTTSPS